MTVLRNNWIDLMCLTVTANSIQTVKREKGMDESFTSPVSVLGHSSTQPILFITLSLSCL